jgi:hypothetical protein
LNADNYATWQVRMQGLLRAKQLWNEVFKEGASPTDDQKAKALHELLKHVDDNQLRFFQDTNDPKKAWDDLKEYHESATLANLMQLKRDLSECHQKENESIDDYVGKLTGILAKMERAGRSTSEQDRVEYLVIGAGVESQSVLGSVQAKVTAKEMK